MDDAVNGDLAADVAADNDAPFNLGTLFTGSVIFNEAATDVDPSPSVAFYCDSLRSFSITGGDINETISTGWASVGDNQIVGSKVQDLFIFASDGFDESFMMNGSTWVFNAAHVIVQKVDANRPSTVTSDALQQQFSESTPWNYQQLVLKFTQ